jgi:hypothetical protein
MVDTIAHQFCIARVVLLVAHGHPGQGAACRQVHRRACALAAHQAILVLPKRVAVASVGVWPLSNGSESLRSGKSKAACLHPSSGINGRPQAYCSNMVLGSGRRASAAMVSDPKVCRRSRCPSRQARMSSGPSVPHPARL